MAKLTARYKIRLSPILMRGEEILASRPIKLKTDIGEAIIYPLGSKERKPESYKGEFKDVVATFESKTHEQWDADTLWIDIDVPPSLFKEKEFLTRLDNEMRRIALWVLRLLRLKLPETPMAIPSGLEYTINLPTKDPQQPYWRYVKPGVKVLSPRGGLSERRWEELRRDMNLGVEPELCDEFIMDAKVALEENDLNRATLYAAIGCEIFIKEYTERIARKANISQKFWEYLKNRRPRVLDYYDSILHLVKGRSLQGENRDMFKLLERLYKRRNEIMHEGKLSLSKDEISQLMEDIRGVERVISWVRGL